MQSESNKKKSYCGYVAIIGKPNVGKSTLLNKILTQKISITARKPQTTRHRILGIKTDGDFQTIYVDTPGLHHDKKRAINRYMNKVAMSAIREVEVIIFVVEAMKWTTDDQLVLDKLSHVEVPVILAINKVDMVPLKEELFPYIKKLTEKRQFAAVVPISATKNVNVADLQQEVKKLLPEGAFLYYPEQITDRDHTFLAAEIIREKLVRFLGQELPYATTVVIENFEDKENVLHVSGIIFVEREGQKIIIIGKGGGQLKKIGTYARKDMENLFAKKIYLELWVKVKDEWSNDEKILKQFGYT